MRRGLLLTAVAVLGLALGMGTLLALHPADAPPAPREAISTPPAGVTPAPKAAPAPPEDRRLLLAWISGGLPEDFARGIGGLAGVEALTVVAGDIAELVAAADADGQQLEQHIEDWVVPLDAIAIDVDTYLEFVPKSDQKAFAALEPGRALLSTTSATLRGLGTGGTITLADGMEVVVAGVVDDEVVGGAELVLPSGSPRAATPRYVLLTYTGERAAIEEAVRNLSPHAPVRLRGPGESPFLRHGDAVLPQASVKERFGEFAYRRTSGRDLEQDPAFVAAHIVDADVSILGRVRCHRLVVDALRGALAELVERNLSHTVDPHGYAGCHSSRLTSSETSVSRHAWGIAFDLNYPDNPVGQASGQDARLVEVMERWGFTWGGQWLVPDPAHFEYLRPPR